ncbi:MAG: hypothetical protein H6732_14045 [Alphaproteobacteria bacterium]|nr:hypothetical protein [Alphaproteobacteria bacterium]
MGRRPWIVGLVLAGCVAPVGDPDAPGVAPDDVGDDSADDSAGPDDTSDTARDTSDSASVASPPFDGMRSGSRLQAVAWSAGPGTEVFAHFHDTLLGVDCDPLLASDGVVRCLPRTGVQVLGYRDATCRARAWFAVGLDAHDAGYVREEVPDERVCGHSAHVRIFQGRPEPLAGEVYDWGIDTNACETRGLAAQLSQPLPSTVYALDLATDTPVDPTAFVAFTAEDRLGTAGVGVRVLRADDGAEVAIDLVDDHDTCHPRLLEGVTRCTGGPFADRVNGGWWGGAGCDAQALARVGTRPGCPAPRRVLARNHLVDGYALFEIGAPWTGEVQVGDAQSCAPWEGPGPWIELGDPIPAATIPAVSEVAEGPGPVHRRRWADAVGDLHLVADAPWSVDGVDGTCDAVRFADDRVACVPDGTVRLDAEPVYADAACSTPVFRTAQPHVLTGAVDLCDATAGPRSAAQAWSLATDEHVGPVYGRASVWLVGSVCREVREAEPGDGWHVGTAVDPTVAFPELARAVAP